MKTVVWGVALVALLVLSWLGLTLVGTDIVESNYVSVQEARADHLFERGWLPDILPTSAHDIRTSNNLDLNTSTGRFYFASSDLGEFLGRLAPYMPMGTPFEGYEQEIQKKEARGFISKIFVGEDAVWVFTCKLREGYCEYDMWLKRG
jgi:hypothetical protein